MQAAYGFSHAYRLPLRRYPFRWGSGSNSLRVWLGFAIRSLCYPRISDKILSSTSIYDPYLCLNHPKKVLFELNLCQYPLKTRKILSSRCYFQVNSGKFSQKSVLRNKILSSENKFLVLGFNFLTYPCEMHIFHYFLSKITL